MKKLMNIQFSRLTKKVLFIFCSILLLYITVELLCLLLNAYMFKEIKLASNYRKYNSVDYQNISYKGGCNSYEAYLQIDPFLAYKYNRNGECTDENKAGFTGRKHRDRKNNETFDVVILGGSVAEQISRFMAETGETYIEKKLNEILSPSLKKPVRVYSIALGDYSQPIQAIGLLTVAHWADAIIDISGYNESHFLDREYGGKEKYRVPANFFKVLERNKFNFARQSYFIAKDFLRNFSKNKLLKYSYLLLTLEVKLKDFYRLYIAEQYELNKENSLKNTNSFDFLELENKKEMYETRMEMSLSYYRSMDAIIKERDIKRVFFIQPALHSKKKPTKIEKQILRLKYGSKKITDKYKREYKYIEDSLMKLKNLGLPIYSLVKVFDNKGQTFVDDVHIDLNDYSRKSGGKIMIDEIVSIIKLEWNFDKKNEY